MKKFKFSLEPLLNFKGVMEKNKEQELYLLATKKVKILDEIKELVNKREEYIDIYSNELALGVYVSQVKSYQQFFHGLGTMMQEKNKEIYELDANEEKLRQELIEIRKEKKMLEVLKDKKSNEYKALVRAQEEKQIDELITYKESLHSS